MEARMIFSVDPGLTTGWASWNGATFTSGEVEGGTIPFLDLAWSRLFDENPQVVCESYTIRPGTHKMSPQHYSLEIIGGLRWMTHKLYLPFSLQGPGEAKKFATNDKLKRAGFYCPTPGGHSLDAARHLLIAALKDPAYRDILLAQLVDPIYNKRRIARED